MASIINPPYGLTQHSSDHSSLNVVINTPVSKNLFDKTRATDGVYITSAGNVSNLSSLGVSDHIPVTPGVQYTCSQANVSNCVRFVAFFNSAFSPVAGGSDSVVYQFTAPVGSVYVRVTYFINATLNKNVFQMESGSSATSYSNYSGSLNSLVNVSDKNISQITPSINLFNYLDAIDGFYLSNTNSLVPSSAFGVSGMIPVIPGVVYTFSDWVGQTSGSVASTSIYRFTTYFDMSGNYVAGGSGGSGSSGWQFTVPSGVYFIRFSYNIVLANGMTSGKSSIQVERGSISTKYVPYSRSFLNDSGSINKTTYNSSWGLERLRRFKSWKRSPDYSYDLVMMGDSYIDGNYFCKNFKSNLISRGFTDGGPGLLAFFGGDGALASQSIDSSQLSCSFTSGDWTSTYNPSYGVSGSDVVSASIGKIITITSSIALATITLIYKLVPSGAGFTYAVNGGGAVTVSTANSINLIGTVVINTSSSGSSFTIVIASLGAGVSLSGAIGRKSVANSLTVHKSGLTGSQASMFGGSLYQSGATNLMPNGGGVMFIWGTNEISANIPPSIMKGYIQNIANYWRSIDPYCDLLFIGPPQTSRGVETTTTYTTAEYNDVMYQLAIENSGAAFIGFEKIFGQFAQAAVDKGFIHADRIHPGTRGSTLISETLSSIFS